MNAFKPKRKSTVNISVGATAAAIKVSESGGPVNVRIRNTGSAEVFIEGGASSIEASAASGIPIGANSTEVLTFETRDGTALYISAIAAGSTGVIYFTPGEGL